MPFGHAIVRGVVAVARVLPDVGGANDPLSLKSGAEDFGLTRHRELRKGLTRNPGDGVQRVGFPAIVHQVIEECAQPRAGEFGGLIGHGLYQPLQVEFRREQLPDTVHLLERLGLLAQRLLGLPLLVDIARHVGEPAQLPNIVPQGRNEDARAEPRTVLADPPALFLVGALILCHLKLVLGLSAPDILLRVKDGEVPPEDLLFPVTLDAARPLVPANHVSFGVEHKDPIVFYALHQQPEALFARLEGLGSPLAFSDVDEGHHGACDFSFLDYGMGRILYRERASVFPPEDLLCYPAALPRPDCPVQGTRFLGIRRAVRVGVVNERVQGRAQELLGFVPEHPLARSVNEGDSTLQIEAEYAFVRRLQHRSRVRREPRVSRSSPLKIAHFTISSPACAGPAAPARRQSLYRNRGQLLRNRPLPRTVAPSNARPRAARRTSTRRSLSRQGSTGRSGRYSQLRRSRHPGCSQRARRYPDLANARSSPRVRAPIGYMCTSRARKDLASPNPRPPRLGRDSAMS